jgi:hypothetical protein
MSAMIGSSSASRSANLASMLAACTLACGGDGGSDEALPATNVILEQVVSGLCFRFDFAGRRETLEEVAVRAPRDHVALNDHP